MICSPFVDQISGVLSFDENLAGTMVAAGVCEEVSYNSWLFEHMQENFFKALLTILPAWWNEAALRGSPRLSDWGEFVHVPFLQTCLMLC